MLDSKLAKIKDLIIQREKIDGELAQLLGEAEKPKRGRPSKAAELGHETPSSQ